MTTIKEKVVTESIKRAKSEIEKIDLILNANPLGRVCEIRIEAQKILHKHGNDNATIAKLLKPMAIEEKKMFLLYEKQKDMVKLIDRKVHLEHELYELGNELYIIERNNKRKGRGW